MPKGSRHHELRWAIGARGVVIAREHSCMTLSPISSRFERAEPSSEANCLRKSGSATRAIGTRSVWLGF